jgi:pimeloyl-ACP methyl ester carboxylesterase
VLCFRHRAWRTNVSEPTDAFVTLRGLRFHYRDWGGRGRPVVLLHGLASTARIWDLVAPLLTARHRVVALDQRGHGESDKPDEGYDFATITGDLAAFLEALAFERPLLVGHSWGASVVLTFAAGWPGVPAGLALVDGGFSDLQARYTWEEAEQAMAPPDLSALTREQLLERVRRGDLGRLWSAAIEDVLLSIFEITSAGTVRARLGRQNHLRILRALWELRPITLYEAVRCPVLLAPAVRADDPRGAEFTAQRRAGVLAAQRALRDGTVVWFEETIHDIPLQRPSELAAAILALGERQSDAAWEVWSQDCGIWRNDAEPALGGYRTEAEGARALEAARAHQPDTDWRLTPPYRASSGPRVSKS